MSLSSRHRCIGTTVTDTHYSTCAGHCHSR